MTNSYKLKKISYVVFVIYIPPQYSIRYAACTEQNEILKCKLEEMLSVNEKCSLLVFGDLNARTGKELDYILDDNIERISGLEWYTAIDFSRRRESKDNHVNIFGRTSL